MTARSGRRRDVLASEWCAWIARNVVAGVTSRKLVSTLVASGVPRALATRSVDEIRSSPALHGVAAAQRWRDIADLRARLARELARASPTTVERRRKPSAAAFYDRYWAQNRPVVLTDATKGWRLWTPRDMARLVGDVSVEVSSRRHDDPEHDQKFAAHAETTTIAAFVERVLAAPATNDFYMVAQSKAMERPAMRALLRRIVLDEELFDPDALEGGTSLWLGPKGTITPLHHDGTNVFFAQIFGRKRFTLVPPYETQLLESARGFYANIDPEAPNLARHPWWADISVFHVDLAPGEVLFLPVGWWHHVRALDVSISLSLLNFRRPNAFDWYRPGRVTGEA